MREHLFIMKVNTTQQFFSNLTLGICLRHVKISRWKFGQSARN